MKVSRKDFIRDWSLESQFLQFRHQSATAFALPGAIHRNTVIAIINRLRKRSLQPVEPCPAFGAYGQMLFAILLFERGEFVTHPQQKRIFGRMLSKSI